MLVATATKLGCRFSSPLRPCLCLHKSATAVYVGTLWVRWGSIKHKYPPAGSRPIHSIFQMSRNGSLHQNQGSLGCSALTVGLTLEKLTQIGSLTQQSLRLVMKQSSTIKMPYLFRIVSMVAQAIGYQSVYESGIPFLISVGH